MSEPVLRVVRGQPSDEDAAALVVAVVALAARARAARQAGSAPQTANWASHARALRVPPAPGGDAWRRSALPA